MNAALKIDGRALTLPAFDNKNVRHGGLWVRDNMDALRVRYEALGKALPDEASDDHHAEHGRAEQFLRFCQVQHDIVRMFT